MTQLGSVTKTAVTMPATGPAWKHWNLVALTGLTAYSTAVSWLAQQVMYPLYRAVGPGEFAAYHLQYNDAIPAPIVIPGFVGFASAVAFLWTRPAGVPRWAAALVSLGGVTCIASTVLLGDSHARPVGRHRPGSGDDRQPAVGEPGPHRGADALCRCPRLVPRPTAEPKPAEPESPFLPVTLDADPEGWHSARVRPTVGP